MQSGSAAIIIDFFNTHRNSSWPMDDNMWRQLGGVLIRHYFFFKEELVIPEKIYPVHEAWDPYLLHRNHAQVVVNAERLKQVVEGVVTWIRRDAGRMARAGSTTGVGGKRRRAWL